MMRTAPFSTSRLLRLGASVALLTLSSEAASAQAPMPGYGPFTGRYRVVSRTHQTQVQMGQTQEFENSSSEVSTIVVAKSGAALSLSMRTDSASATTTAPVPAPDVSVLVGATFAGAMGFDGQVTGSTVTDKGGKPLDSPLATAMKSFLPKLKVGATVGSSWDDSTSTSAMQNGTSVTTKTVVTYTLAGDTTIAGTKHWKLGTVSSGTLDGTGNQSGADYTLKGTITGQGMLVVGAGGVLVGADNTNEVKMIVDVPMAGMQIPITQKSTRTIARIP